MGYKSGGGFISFRIPLLYLYVWELGGAGFGNEGMDSTVEWKRG